MAKISKTIAIVGTMVGLSLLVGAQSVPGCKSVEHYGVKGCEPLSDQSCPAGHHKQAVGPSNPQMKGPTFLMCVPDKPEPKKQAPVPPPPGGHQPT
jgi:hypothetical protein